jgi:tellurite resistance protein TerC
MGEAVTAWMWAVFAAVTLVMISIDLIAHRGDRVDSVPRAVIWTAVWIAVAIAFGVLVTIRLGSTAGEQFFAAYLLEKSLSLDNLFLFLVVFTALGIPAAEQRRVLTWGIVGALVARGAFIVAGTALLHRWHEVSYLFGGILVITAFKVLRESGPPGESRLLAWLERHLPWTRERHGHRFFARVANRWVATPLLVALIVIELTDVMFAIDSIPASFAVTEDTFLIYSSNVFAVLGLRSLYIAVARVLTRLKYVRFGLSGVIGFAGAKMLLAHWIEVSPAVSITVIAGVLATTVLASLLAHRRAS